MSFHSMIIALFNMQLCANKIGIIFRFLFHNAVKVTKYLNLIKPNAKLD